ncbi:MAG: plasmid transfer protein traf [Robiginitomaculum sp.]|nr:MAG: plasmid transfer protein traf [Robiginitomaculum sp.]
MMMKLLLAASITVLCAGVSLQTLLPPKKKFIYNPTPSAPIGWYKIVANDNVKVGDFVAAYAPESAVELAVARQYLPSNIPLLKSVWAVGGAEVCFENARVSVPNYPVLTRYRQDNLGRDMPVLTGCFVLNPNEVFLISTEISNSFDSRYFGAVPLKNVLGNAIFLGGERE